MILCILLTIFLCWLVLMGWYWAQGRKGKGIDGNNPAAKGFFTDSLRRSLNFMVSQPNYWKELARAGNRDREFLRGNLAVFGCGHPCMVCGVEAPECPMCHGDPNHGKS